MAPVPDFDEFDGASYSALEDPEGAVAATAALLTADRKDAPPQIPQAPHTHLQLEQGLLVDGEFVRDAEVRELSGKDEEALARCGEDFAKVLETLVVRGTRTIGSKFMTKDIADRLLIGDREALILAVRRATFGDYIDFEGLPCPHCGERSDVRFHLDDVPVHHLEDPDQTEFAVPLRFGATAFVRLPNGADQMAVQAISRQSEATQNSLMLSRCINRIEYPDGDVLKGSAELPQKMSMSDRFTLISYFVKAQPGPRFANCSFTHEVCDQEVELPLTLAMLFR